MPAYLEDPRDQIIAIQRNLRDRYRTRLSILKELIQNADDAGAQRLALDLRDGRQDATNPLLRGPGLLVVNDGRFTTVNERGIRRLSATSKTEEAESAGRFGLGQKAVFHISDAFVVAPFGYPGDFEPFIVNPFYGLEETHSRTAAWEDLTGVPDQLRHWIDPMTFAGQHLALWLPLRRQEIVPYPPAGQFDAWIFGESQLVSELTQPPILTTILAASRHLDQFQILQNGQALLTLSRDGAHMTGLSPDGASNSFAGKEAFGGTIRISEKDERLSAFRGRESLSADDTFRSIKGARNWPQTWTINRTQVPEKAEPHGATFLVRHDEPQSQLAIYLGVFLPTGEEPQVCIPIDWPTGETAINLHLFLHGYFFVDSGRRHIEGFETSSVSAGSTYADICGRWNQLVRDLVTLPALPGLLADALHSGLLQGSELARTVSALASHKWFIEHRAALASIEQLAEVWDGESITWRTLPAGTQLRPLPASLLSRREVLSHVLPALTSFRTTRKIAFFAADPATPRTLSAREPEWLTDEIADLLESMPSAIFKNRTLAKTLRAFLDGTNTQFADMKIGRALCGKLRKAMFEEGSFADGDDIRGVLRYVPDRLLVGLSESAVSTDVLQALASTGREPLAVRAEWLQEGHRPLVSEEAVLADMLRALESLTGGPQVDRAARAAMELIRASGLQLSTLASSAAFRNIAIFPVTEEPTEARLILSLHDLFERSRTGTLLQRQGATNVNLKPVLKALPALRLCLTNDRDLLQALSGFEEGAGTLDVSRAVHFVNAAMKFAEPSGRAGLVQLLNNSWNETDQHFAAMRRLLAGVAEAGLQSAHVYWSDDVDLASLGARLLTHNKSAFVAATELADQLGNRKRDAIGLRRLDTPAVELLLERTLTAGDPLTVTLEQAEKLLTLDLPDHLLKRLPIHQLEDGTFAVVDETVFLASDRSVPTALRSHLRRVRLANSPVVRKRQQELIQPHDAAAEVTAALTAPDPSKLATVIMDALADQEFQVHARENPLVVKLRSKRWIAVGDAVVAPADFLSLPDAVSEAAKAIFGTADNVAWYPQAALPPEVRDHRAFPRLTELVLPDITDSLGKLALQIEEAKLVGLPPRYSSGNTDIRADLATIARADIQFTLPGWPLASALLATDAVEVESVNRCLAEFEPLALGETARFADSLDTLAVHAERRGRIGEAATRLYRRAFEDLVNWGLEQRRAVLAATLVPTAAGRWKPGREVARDGAGLSPDCLLDPVLAEVLRGADREARRAGLSESRAHHGGLDLPKSLLPKDIRELNRMSANGHRDFLEHYRSRIPEELALTYLALMGRFQELREVAEIWASGTTVKHDLIIETTDQKINPQLSKVTLASEIDQRRFLVSPVQGEAVEAVSLTGETFAAALDGEMALLVGNRHTEGTLLRLSDGSVLTIYTLNLRHGVAFEPAMAIASIKQLTRTIASDCLWLSSSEQIRAVDALLDRFSQTSQVLLEQTAAMLRARLPAILEPLKPQPKQALGRLLRKYHGQEQRWLAFGGDNAEDQMRAQQQLWNDVVTEDAACGDLLVLIRAKIDELGYDNHRVLFELFQNADDASWQSEHRQKPSNFQLEAFSNRLRVVHWGRPINHRGTDSQHGEDRGYDRDLINMLLLNFSDKRPEEGVTGKFGLGFKSVHSLTDSVGIASGLIALRTRGGLLPESWQEGAQEVETYRREAMATLIDVPFADGREGAGREAIEAFEKAAPYLPLFAKAIRCIEIDRDGRQMRHRRANDLELTGIEGVWRIRVEGGIAFSALAFDLGEGYSLVTKLGETGLVPFPETARLWHMAPLEQQVQSGWLLNGPFRVIPSRAELHGDVRPLFRRLGRRLGKKLIRLHEVAEADWAAFAETLGLHLDETTPELFWKRLWDLFRRDLDDPLACELHGESGGLAALAACAAIVPSGLEPPFQQLICGSQAKGYFDGSLINHGLLRSIAEWPSIAGAYGEFVSAKTNDDLARLGFRRLHQVTLTTVLGRELALVHSRVEAQEAQRLGSVLSQASIEKDPIAAERPSLRTSVAAALFRDAAGAWRPVSELTIEQSADKAELLRAKFAPPERRLSDAYTGEALRFVELARAESGYSPRPHLLLSWAERAHTRTARIAVLRYLIEIDTGPLRALILSTTPSWLLPLEEVADGALTNEWSREERNHLRSMLRNYEPEPNLVVGYDDPVPELLSTGRVIVAIWDWWAEARVGQVELYERAVYPSDFDRKRLVDRDDREAWFTLFALAAFQNFGGTQDGQHRSFLQEALVQGWWSELAQSRPPDDPDVWLARLESWSRETLPDLTFWRWRRALLDLYTIARWLPQYVRILHLLPHAINARGQIRLSDALTPSFSPIWQQAGIEAAPLVRTLGTGLNWLLRECARAGVYDAQDARALVPYSWGTTRRLRQLLIQRLGSRIDDKASMDSSPQVWRFVEHHAPPRHRRIIESDLDLPLQLITLEHNRDALAECLSAGGVKALSITTVAEDGTDGPDDHSREATE